MGKTLEREVISKLDDDDAGLQQLLDQDGAESDYHSAWGIDEIAHAVLATGGYTAAKEKWLVDSLFIKPKEIVDMRLNKIKTPGGVKICRVKGLGDDACCHEDKSVTLIDPPEYLPPDDPMGLEAVPPGLISPLAKPDLTDVGM